jgi:hypothetical protein
MRVWLRGFAAALVLVVVPLARAADDGAPDSARIEQRIAAVKADTALADADRVALLTELQAAQRDGQDTQAALAERDALIAAAKAAPGRIAALRAERPAAPPAPPIGMKAVGAGVALRKPAPRAGLNIRERDRDRRAALGA